MPQKADGLRGEAGAREGGDGQLRGHHRAELAPNTWGSSPPLHQGTLSPLTCVVTFKDNKRVEEDKERQQLI